MIKCHWKFNLVAFWLHFQLIVSDIRLSSIYKLNVRPLILFVSIWSTFDIEDQDHYLSVTDGALMLENVGQNSWYSICWTNYWKGNSIRHDWIFHSEIHSLKLFWNKLKVEMSKCLLNQSRFFKQNNLKVGPW